MSLPGLSATSCRLVVSMTLAQSTRLLSGRGKTSGFSVLVYGGDDPVDAGITADGLVLGIDKDDFVVFVGRILVNPVGVQYTQIGTTTANTFLSSRLEGSLVLELIDTLVGRLSCIGRPVNIHHSANRLTMLRSITYRRLHPLEQDACGHHDEHEYGR